jgi:hypothetical protein
MEKVYNSSNHFLKQNSPDNIGIFRETSGLWAIRGLTRTYFGTVGDVPVTR